MHRSVPFAAILLLSLSSAFGQVTAKDVEADARRAKREQVQREVEDARSHAVLQEFSASLRETTAALTELEAKATQLNTRLSDLATNDDGKRLATDDLAVFSYIRLVEEPIASIEQIRAKRKNIDEASNGIKKLLDGPSAGFVPSAQQRSDATLTGVWARDRLAQVKERDSWLTSVIERAPKEADLSKAKPLGDIVRDYQAQRLRFLAEAKKAGELAAKDESRTILVETTKIAELERSRTEAEKLLAASRAEVERLRLEHETTLRQQEVAAREAAAVAQSELADRVARLEWQLEQANADRQKAGAEAKVRAQTTRDEASRVLALKAIESSELKQLLAPFLTPGRLWTHVNAKNTDDVSLEKKPVSLGLLRAQGCLEPTQRGLEQLLAAGAYHGDALRPTWPYRVENGVVKLSSLSEAQLDSARKAQKFLLDYGDVMVEKGMLSP